jgi:hypothetical protein
MRSQEAYSQLAEIWADGRPMSQAGKRMANAYVYSVLAFANEANFVIKLLTTNLESFSSSAT